MTSHLNAAETLSRGAIVKPADGQNAKQEGQKCLTCIANNRSCRGTDVVNGDCAICRGATAREGAGFRRRKCFWLEPANNIATYREAQEHYGSVRIPANTKAGRAAAAGGTQADHGVEDISFAEIDTHELERRILGQMIVQLRDEAGVSDDAASNYTSLLALTVVAFDRIGDQYPTGSDLRAQWLVALDVVHGILIGVDTYTDNIFQ